MIHPDTPRRLLQKCRDTPKIRKERSLHIMGVRGLKTFIERQRDILQKRDFRNSKLIIDGSNLYYTLYFSCDLDQAHGGDYDGLEKELRRFFYSLEVCKLKPYVVIDGGTDYTDRKFDTLLSRAKGRIKKARNLSTGRSGEVLPPISKNVFKQFLRNNNVPFVQCVAEADWEAAALANEWNCPVLSNDSDFYIFNIKGGFLPLSLFNWKKVISKKEKKFISAQWFHVNRLCLVYKSMNPDLLPICAAILGNDYTKSNTAQQFPDKHTSLAGAEEHTNIDGWLKKLSHYSCPEEAIDALTKDTKTLYDSKALYSSIEDYRLTSSSIAQFFTSGNPQTNLPGPLKRVPEWLLKPLAEGKLNSIIIDVLVFQRLILNFPVENVRLCSSNQTSRPIRQVIYGLVLGGQPQWRLSSSGLGEFVVEEYDREGSELINSRTTAVLLGHFQPTMLYEAPLELRRKTLLDTLQVYQSREVRQVPDHLQLPVYITCYWMRNAEPEPRPEFLFALLVGLVYGDISREFRTRIDFPQVGPMLSRLRKLQSGRGRNQLDLEVAHAYSQWQCCVRDSLCLNELLNNPVQEPHCAWLYNGTLVHRVVSKLQEDTEPESLLAGGLYPLQLFRKLRLAVEAELRARPRCCADRIDELRREFEHLMGTEEEEDDEDLAKKGKKGKVRSHEDEIYEATSSVRTRHKTKRRVLPGDHRAKKQERVSWE